MGSILKSIAVAAVFSMIALAARADDEMDDAAYAWVPDNSDGTCQRDAAAGADFTDVYDEIASVAEVTAGFGSMPSDSKLDSAIAYSLDDSTLPLASGESFQVASDFRQLNDSPDVNGNVPYLVRQPIGTHIYSGQTLYGNRLYVGPPGANSMNALVPISTE